MRLSRRTIERHELAVERLTKTLSSLIATPLLFQLQQTGDVRVEVRRNARDPPVPIDRTANRPWCSRTMPPDTSGCAKPERRALRLKCRRARHTPLSCVTLAR
jgi:hypothetical protein